MKRCKSFANPLSGTGWQAKIYDIVREVDKMSFGDKGKILGPVSELHALIEELNDRIDRECPTEWSPDKIELDNKIAEITNIWEDAWQNVSGADVGG